jgi:hypothetical protein
MRYLYGDSTPFPLGYNFLTTLEAFMAAVTRIVQLDLEISGLARQREELAQNRVKGLEALEQFHVVVMRAVQDTAQKVRHQHALEYARAIAEHATQYIDEHRRGVLGTNERESVQLHSDNERREADVRAHLESFLRTARIPVLKTNLSLRATGEGKDLRYTATAAFEHPDGVATAFTIATQRTNTWSALRKIADFVQGVSLRVGVEKSWLRGTVTPKELGVDDWTITHLEMSDDALELALRRKPAEKEALVLHVRRGESGALSASVEHPGSAEATEVSGSLGPQDVAQLERLWIALKTTTRDVPEHKDQLLGVTLDGQPVFERQLALPFVVRLVTFFAPVVREIARRSPNEFELTLKVEGDDGRREEHYLRKEALVSTLAPLPARGRQVFAPLGLDSWVPSNSAAPPAVALSEPARRAPEATQLLQSAPPPPASSAPASARKP